MNDNESSGSPVLAGLPVPGPGILGHVAPTAAAPAFDPSRDLWPEVEIRPVVGYVPGFTIFPPLAGALGELTVDQGGVKTVLPFDRAVLDESLADDHADYRDRTLSLGRTLYADFAANFGEVTS